MSALLTDSRFVLIAQQRAQDHSAAMVALDVGSMKVFVGFHCAWSVGPRTFERRCTPPFASQFYPDGL